ncbi:MULTISPECIES: DUF4440 domain-containing protein [Pseudomonas]|uniref:YybH family protein n=1 Tax=Pseudomonas TaxID=286 RepID=UPI001CFA4F27|nr:MULTISPECIES: DUF4440 domain-containing protein [Pseudomonas]
MKIPTCVSAALFTALAASSSAYAADADQTELMNAAVSLGHSYDSNYAAKNPDAMASLYASDGVLVSPSGPLVRGQKALHDYYVDRFKSGAQGHQITIKEVHVTGAGGYSIADFSVNVPGKNGTLHKESGSLVAIYQHDDNGWHLSLVEPSVAAGKHS